jgi:hypothetical protein
MTQRFGSKRRRLAVLAVTTAAAILGAGYAYGAIRTTTTANQYTGCLANGSIQYVAIGLSPQKTCQKPAVQISWSETGPQGLQGVQGLQGIQGIQGVKGDTGLTGTQGIQGTAGTNGAAGVSPTVVSLPVDNVHCPAGGAAITDASNSTAYVCSGQQGEPGQAGAPFSGTFTSGNYSISVTATGIILQGPGANRIRLTDTDLRIESNDHPITIKGGLSVDLESGTTLGLKSSNLNANASGQVTVHAASTLDLKGSLVSINSGLSCSLAARVGDPIVGSTDGISVTGHILFGEPTVCIGG